MIDLGSTDFYIDVPSLPRHQFEEYSTKLFDEWEAYVEEVLKIPDYSLSLEVEEGSIKGGAKVAATLYALYMGVGQYGSFMSGVQTIQGQLSSAGDFLVAHATAPFSAKDVKPKIKKNSGTLGKLQRLFLKVQNGKLTAEQAMLEVEVMFGEEGESELDFMKDMKKSFENMPLLAQQLDLPFSVFEQDVFLKTSQKMSLPRPTRPKPEPPLGQQFRVEVWRDSKKEKRKVRVIEL
ncbi:hypothetical protein ABHN98_02650 [Pseudomonas syringae]